MAARGTLGSQVSSSSRKVTAPAVRRARASGAGAFGLKTSFARIGQTVVFQGGKSP